MFRLTRFILLGLSFGILSLGNITFADVMNGSFESGMASWSSVGPNSAVPDGTINGFNATEGTSYAYIHTGNGAQSVLVQDFVLQSLGISAGYVAGNFPAAVEGAILFQTFTLGASHDELVFDWNFLSDEGIPSEDFNDFAFAHLFDNSMANIDSAYLDTFSTFTNFGGSEYDADTGWQSVSFGGLTAGATYTLVFGVFDSGDGVVDSALLVDNVRSVPEPSSLSLLALSGLAILVRRRNSVR